MIWQNHDVQHSYQEKLKKLGGCFERRHGDVGLLSVNLIMFMESFACAFIVTCAPEASPWLPENLAGKVASVVERLH